MGQSSPSTSLHHCLDSPVILSTGGWCHTRPLTCQRFDTSRISFPFGSHGYNYNQREALHPTGLIGIQTSIGIRTVKMLYINWGRMDFNSHFGPVLISLHPQPETGQLGLTMRQSCTASTAIPQWYTRSHQRFRRCTDRTNWPAAHSPKWPARW